MYGNLGDGIVGLFQIMIVSLAIFVPLGIWKLVELASILLNHISWK